MVHNVIRYLVFRMNSGERLNRNSILFVWQDYTIITTRDIAKNLQYYLQILGIDLDGSWTAHSFRYGGITDLRLGGVEDWLIRKVARHAPGSASTWHYTVTTSLDEASLIKQMYEKQRRNNY